MTFKFFNGLFYRIGNARYIIEYRFIFINDNLTRKVLNPLRSKGSKNCPILMKFRQIDHFVGIKRGFKGKIHPGPEKPIFGPSSYEDSGDTVRSTWQCLDHMRTVVIMNFKQLKNYFSVVSSVLIVSI